MCWDFWKHLLCWIYEKRHMWLEHQITPLNSHFSMIIALFMSILYSNWISHSHLILSHVYRKVSLKFNLQFICRFSTWTFCNAILQVNFVNSKMCFKSLTTDVCSTVSCLQSMFNERITGLIELVIELIVVTCLKPLYTLLLMHFSFHFHRTLGCPKVYQKLKRVWTVQLFGLFHFITFWRHQCKAIDSVLRMNVHNIWKCLYCKL